VAAQSGGVVPTVFTHRQIMVIYLVGLDDGHAPSSTRSDDCVHGVADHRW
jgi:hypothetical protein